MWICQRSNEILMFSVLSDFVRRLVVIALCYFFIVFGSLLFAKQWGEYVIKTKVFWMIPIWHLQILMKIWCRKRDFGRWILRPRLINFDGNSCCFLTILLLRFVKFLSELRNVMLLQESEKVNISRDVEQQLRFLMSYMMDPEGEIVNISKDV